MFHRLKDFYSSNKVLIFISLIGFLVRLWGIDFGLPDKHIIDEQSIVYSSFYSAAHNLRPHPYLHAPLVQYILLIEFGIYFLAGKIFGFWGSTFDFAVSYLRDPTTIFLIGRITAAFFGALTIWTVGKIGEHFFRKRVGILAAILMAFSFLHVKESHYIKEDVVSAFFLTCSFYFVLALYTKSKLRNYLLSGIFLAFAVSSKPTAVIFLPVILIAHLLVKGKKVTKNLIFMGIASFIIYLLTNPYLLIDPKGTLSWILGDFTGNRERYEIYLQGRPIWKWFFEIHLPNGLGPPLFLAGVVGFILCIVRKGRFILIPLLPLIFFLTVDLWTQYHHARLSLMNIPFFVLSAGILVQDISERFKSRKLQVTFLVIISIIMSYQSFIKSVKFNTLITSSDTRKLARLWFEKNIRPGSRVLIEAMLKPEIPSNTNISLNLSQEAIDKRITQAEMLETEITYLAALKKANSVKVGYEIVATPRITVRYDVLTNQITPVVGAKKYRDEGVLYIVTSSWVEKEMARGFEESLVENYYLLQEFQPTYKFIRDPHFIELDYSVLDKVDPFKSDIIFGPTIRIYELK